MQRTADTATRLVPQVSSEALLTVVSALPSRPSPAATVWKPIEASRPPLGTPTIAATLNEVLEWHIQQHADATHAIVLADEESAIAFLLRCDQHRMCRGTARLELQCCVIAL